MVEAPSSGPQVVATTLKTKKSVDDSNNLIVLGDGDGHIVNILKQLYQRRIINFQSDADYNALIKLIEQSDKAYRDLLFKKLSKNQTMEKTFDQGWVITAQAAERFYRGQNDDYKTIQGNMFFRRLQAALNRMEVVEGQEVIFIGDMLQDRYSNSKAMLMLFETMNNKGINFKIIYSNHDFRAMVVFKHMKFYFRQAGLAENATAKDVYHKILQPVMNMLNARYASAPGGSQIPFEYSMLTCLYSLHKLILEAPAGQALQPIKDFIDQIENHYLPNVSLAEMKWLKDGESSAPFVFSHAPITVKRISAPEGQTLAAAKNKFNELLGKHLQARGAITDTPFETWLKALQNNTNASLGDFQRAIHDLTNGCSIREVVIHAYQHAHNIILNKLRTPSLEEGVKNELIIIQNEIGALINAHAAMIEEYRQSSTSQPEEIPAVVEKLIGQLNGLKDLYKKWNIPFEELLTQGFMVKFVENRFLGQDMGGALVNVHGHVGLTRGQYDSVCNIDGNGSSSRSIDYGEFSIFEAQVQPHAPSSFSHVKKTPVSKKETPEKARKMATIKARKPVSSALGKRPFNKI